MKLILLSGGSGKRMWPLSSATRSKQFLKLIESPEGDKESIFQRVIRQINEWGKAGTITIATNSELTDITTNQLNGMKADVVVEPEMRGTFPAVLLSCAYLALEKGCDNDEIVTVVPCDPYIESDYFDCISEMAEAVKNNVAELLLMGVKPSKPSSKFGYVMPVADEKNNKLMTVDHFVEKPNVILADKLIDEGAYWNGGVFVFRLGYIMNILKSYIQASSFEEIKKNFHKLPAASFDNEVAEKEKSVAMVAYTGTWKDLGSWNSLAEELENPYMGNVVADKTTRGTCVINELEDLPVVCVGAKDMVVAASPDGILVCSKDATEYNKQLVDNIKSRPMYEERRWGLYKVIGNTRHADGCRSLTKLLHLNPGCGISYQTHSCREEVWTFVDGEGLLVLDGEVRKVGRGDVICIKAGVRHAIRAITHIEIIEVQLGTNLVEEDIERYDWDWDKVLCNN